MDERILQSITPKAQTRTIDSSATIRQALEVFDHYKFTVVPIIDEKGIFVGSLSEGDVLRYIKNEANFDIKVAENTPISAIKKYRTYQALSIYSEFEEIVRLALEQNFVPLVDDRGVYIGMLTRRAVVSLFLSDQLSKAQ